MPSVWIHGETPGRCLHPLERGPATSRASSSRYGRRRAHVGPAPERASSCLRSALPRPESQVGRSPPHPTAHASVAQRGDATKGRGQARSRKSRGGGSVTYIRRVAGGPCCCWVVCCEGGSKLPAASGGTPRPPGRESGGGSEGRSLGQRGWSGRREGRGGGLRRRGWGGGEVTRRRFCGAAGLVLGGNGLTRPDLLGPLPVSGYQVDPAFR